MRTAMRGVFAGVVLAVLTVGCGQSDTGITTSVKAKLAADDTVEANDINVDTKDRVVTLTGAVETQAEKERAVQIARETEGVRDVVDNLTVEQAGIPGDENAKPTTGRMEDYGDRASGAMSDAAITAAVKSKLLADPDTGGLSINVDTRYGVVTLKGRVKSEAERAEATRIARETDGVKRVVLNLEIGQ